jgi:hypothetical protein
LEFPEIEKSTTEIVDALLRDPNWRRRSVKRLKEPPDCFYLKRIKKTENSGQAGLVARYLAGGRYRQASFFVRLAQSTNCKLRIKVITTNE